ncbi:MAG: hypothetical protein HRT42_10190 [Campylobacteraceae bacterium]|nr:hypothetical protein [Campylobacteraceae bacterium]
MRLIGKWIYKIIKWYSYSMLLLSIVVAGWELYLLEIVNISGLEREYHIMSIHDAGWAFITFLVLSVVFLFGPLVIKNRKNIFLWIKDN